MTAGAAASVPAPTPEAAPAPAATPATAPAATPAAAPGAAAAAPGWTLLPTLVVRSAGFPWQLVDGLAYRRTVAAGDRLDQLTARAEELARELGSRYRLNRGQRARLRNHRPVPAELEVPDAWRQRWTELVEAIAAQRHELAEALHADETCAAEALRTMVADPRYAEAVACSSPAAYRDLTRQAPSAARLRRQAAAYAQRLATKCETMSFFGPINYATVVVPQTGSRAELTGNGSTLNEPTWNEPSWKGHRVCADRRAYLSAWAFDRIQTAVLGELLADPARAGALVPRRKGLAGMPEQDQPLARLLGAVDGRRTLAELCQDAGTDLDLNAALAALHRGIRAGLLTHDLLAPATIADPTRWLVERLGPDAGRLAPLVELLDRYPAAPAAEKVHLQREVTRLAHPDESERPAPVAPGSGKFYHDRLPVTEAAAGTLELSVGGALAADLHTAVPRALDLLARVALGTRARTNQLLAGTLGPGTFPLLQVLRRCAELPVMADPWLTEAIATALTGAPEGTAELDLAELGLDPELRLDPELGLGPEIELEPGDADPAGPSLTPLPVLCSVDVLVATDELAGYRAGRTPLVLGDVHDAPLLTPWAVQFHPDRDLVLAARDEAITGALGGITAISVLGRRVRGLPPVRFPGPVVEFGTAETAVPSLSLDRMYVSSDGRTARLRARGIAADLYWHNGELDSGVHTALALPRLRPPVLPDADHIPRLRIGNVVLARRRWLLDPATLPARSGGQTVGDWLATRQVLRAAGVPDRFFAKAPHERKPVFVDTASPWLVDGLSRLAQDGNRLRLSEVLPDGDGLWLQDGVDRFAAEFRCVYLRPAGRHPQQNGQHPQQNGQHPDQNGQHPDQNGRHPDQNGSGRIEGGSAA